MSTVLGIDPSLTATATCRIVDGHDVRIDSNRTKPTGSAHLQKLTRMNNQVTYAAVAASSADLVLIEGPSFSSKGAATRDLAGLWWLMYASVISACPRVGVVPPSTLKKWATGKGNADKFLVGQHIAKRWPAIALETDDQADALGLASIGLQIVDLLPWAPPAHQRETVEKIDWSRPVRPLALAAAGAKAVAP